MHFERGKNSAGLGGRVLLLLLLGLMWQEVAGSWSRNPHGWKALATPLQCMYALDLWTVYYTRHSQTKQVPASGHPDRAPWRLQPWTSLSCLLWLQSCLSVLVAPQPGKPGSDPSPL